MSEHAKTPWDYYVATMAGDDIAVIHPEGEPDDYRICVAFDEAGEGTSPEASARHIVKCVNYHEPMRGLLKRCAEELADLVHARYADCPISDKGYVMDMEAVNKAMDLLSNLEAEDGN